MSSRHVDARKDKNEAWNNRREIERVKKRRERKSSLEKTTGQRERY